MNLTENTKSFSLFAQNIIKSAAYNIFKDDKFLFCLIKSDYFYKDLFELFNTLNFFKITPEIFNQIISSNLFSKTDLSRLELFSSLYAYYVKTMKTNSFDIPRPFVFLPNFKSISKNEDITRRLDFLIDKIKSNNLEHMSFGKSENIQYIVFNDIQAEAFYISEKIKNIVNSGICSYSDIAVFADKSEARQKFLDVMKAQNIPVLSSIYNEQYENFKRKISVYYNICKICLDLQLESFSSESFKNVAYTHRAKKEILLEKLDEIIKNLVAEIIDDNNLLDRISAKQENSKQNSYLMTIFSLWNEIDEKYRQIFAAEFGSIKIFYEDYKNNKYNDAIIKLIKKFYKSFENTDLLEIISGKIKSLNELQYLYDSLLKIEPDFSCFKEILEWLPQSQEKDSVTLASISKKMNKSYKFVFVSGLTENNFPGTNPSYPFISLDANEVIVENCKKINPDFPYFLKTDDIFLKEKYTALFSVMEMAENKIVFSTHSYESKKTVQPSQFLRTLIEVDADNFENFESYSEKDVVKNNIEILDSKKQSDSNIILDSDVLKLNASAISTYQKCPKKYYYKHLLNLKEPYVFSASYGSAVHCVMEVLSRKFLHSYDKNTALELADILFNSYQNEQKALDVGFSQTDVELIKQSDLLSIAQMKNNLKDALEDLDLIGYFDEIPDCAICEKSFSFTIEELDGVVFDGRIDAILRYGDNCKIIDYKTGKDKENKLSYAISENGVNFKTEAGKEPSNVEVYKNRYDYQIPLYYLACQNDKNLVEFKDKVSELGLLYIRPKTKENGCKEDFIPAFKIEEYKDKIIQNLKENVIDKIRAEKEFKKNKSWACENCAFKFLCDEDETDD